MYQGGIIMSTTFKMLARAMKPMVKEIAKKSAIQISKETAKKAAIIGGTTAGVAIAGGTSYGIYKAVEKRKAAESLHPVDSDEDEVEVAATASENNRYVNSTTNIGYVEKAEEAPVVTAQATATVQTQTAEVEEITDAAIQNAIELLERAKKLGKLNINAATDQIAMQQPVAPMPMQMGFVPNPAFQMMQQEPVQQVLPVVQGPIITPTADPVQTEVVTEQVTTAPVLTAKDIATGKKASNKSVKAVKVAKE